MEAEFLVSAILLGQGASLAEIPDIFCNIDLVHWLLELREEISFVPGVLAGLRMFLVPTLGPCSGFVLQVNDNLGNP